MLRGEDRLPEPGLMRVRIYSRFTNATKHQLWVSYQPVNENQENEENNGEGFILGYYCTCKSGAQTVGAQQQNMNRLYLDQK